MNPKIIFALLIVLGIVLTVINPLIMALLSIVFWMYLTRMVKTNNRIKKLKWLKIVLVVAILSFVLTIIGILLHNIRSAKFDGEESLFFITAIVAMYIFILSTAGGLIIVLRARKK